MNQTDWTWLPNILLLVFCCLVPGVLAVIGAFFAFRGGRRVLNDIATPDPAKLKADFDRKRAENPSISREQLVQKIIADQAMKSGLVGALTGLGGFITLPITLPLDLYATTKIQGSMVSFIAYAYGKEQLSELEQTATSYLIMTGSRQLGEMSLTAVVNVLTRLMGKTLSKFIPVFGAITSFGINYLFTQAIGRVAVERYGGRLQTLPGERPPSLPPGT